MSALPRPTRERESDLRDAFWQHVSLFPEGHKIQQCLQCGTCTGSCPVAYAMDLTPRQMIGLFRAGRLPEILRSQAIWICASCYACTVRCPSGIRVTDTFYALKRLAMQEGIFPKNFPVNRLARKFMASVYRHGRNFELGLGFHYYLHKAPIELPRNAGFGLTLMKRGRLGLRPCNIKAREQVRAIIDSVQAMEAS